MIVARALLVASLVLFVNGTAAVVAQPAPSTALTPSDDERADALLGLARVARERGAWAEAHSRFRESARLRPLTPPQLEELFWIAARADRVDALRLANEIAVRGRASEDLYARWIALSLENAAPLLPLDAALMIVERAERAYPDSSQWLASRASIALRAERAGQVDLAWRAWTAVPEESRVTRADWQGSYLRVAIARSGRAQVVLELDRFVTAFPADGGMRRLAVEAWADAGQPGRALRLMAPLLGQGATREHLRRAADLARQSGDQGQALQLLTRLNGMPGATDDDTWALATVLAARKDVDGIRQLLASRELRLDSCRTKLVDVALASGDDALLADVVPALPVSCANYGLVAPRVARVWLERGRPADAETWLAPIARAGHLQTEDRFVLARAYASRQAWNEVEAVLAPVLAGTDAVAARMAARSTAWALHARGRTAEAWALVQRTGAPSEDTVDAQAGWAGLAAVAGDVITAEHLAKASLGSAADIDARAVLASLAIRQGHPAEARAWLAPVQQQITDAGHLALWLDLVAVFEGPEAAWKAARDRDAVVSREASLLARRAVWAAQAGHADAAAEDANRVPALQPDLGARVAARIANASGEHELAWALASTGGSPSTSNASAEWAHVRLEAALATGRWAEAETLLNDVSSAPTGVERILAMSRLHLGRDSRLPDDLRRALEALAGGDSPVAAARLVLASDALARHAPAEALTWIGVSSERLSAISPSADVRAVAAEALLALGRPADVLHITSTSDRHLSLQLARARALVSLDRGAEAATTLAVLARETGRPEAYLTWADATADPAARLAVVDQALQRHPEHLGLRLARADALRLSGDLAAALVESHRLLAQAPSSRKAWRIRLSTLAAAEPATLPAAAQAARAALGDDADSRLLVADAVTSAPQVPEALVDPMVESLRDMPASHAARAARAQVALGVGAGRWPVALDGLARLKGIDGGNPEVLRLEAHVTAWSGAHEAALPLFARYLELKPDDRAAWRQYARVLTWRGEAEKAADAYARAEALASTPGLTAEARTRLAILRRNWPEAATAAHDWRRAEPTTLDALVDLALALDQAGDADGATTAYDVLARWPGLPAPVQQTVAAFQWKRAPHGRVGYEIDHADGFSGQRLLERRESVIGGDARLTANGAWETFGRLGQGVLDGSGDDVSFTQGHAGVRAWFGGGVVAEGYLGGTSQGSGTGATTLGGARLGFRLTPSVGVDVSTLRRPFWENATTVRAGLQGWTTGARLRLLGRGQLEASAGVETTALSDGNDRPQVDATVARQFGGGTQQFEVRASAFLFGFAHESPDYFSPSAFGRADLEFGMTRWLGRGATVRDGRFAWRGRGGTGLDTDGKPYLLGSAGIVVPLGGWVSLSGDARWTSSSHYRAWSAVVGVQAGVPSRLIRAESR